MTQNTYRTYLLTLFFTLLLGNAYGQLDHPRVENEVLSDVLPPHGGQLKEAGKYIIEMVAEMYLAENQLMFYLYRGELKPKMIENIIGRIIIKENDSIVSEQNLVARGNEFFVGQFKSSKSFSVKVRFIIKGRAVSTLFIHHGIN